MTHTQAVTLKKKFLNAYARCGSISHAAKEAGIFRSQHYRWLNEDARYAKLFLQAEEILTESLEFEARQRAIKGSDLLLIFLLKGLKPDKYRDNVNVNHSGTVNIVERLRTGRERALQAAQERLQKETVH